MNLTISASSLFTRRFLKVRKNGVKYYGSSFWGARRFDFDEIECLLMSVDNQLSFQVGGEVFTIATRPDKPRHQAVIAALMEGLEASRARPGSTIRYRSAP